jgi:hypothetical protein
MECLERYGGARGFGCVSCEKRNWLDRTCRSRKVDSTQPPKRDLEGAHSRWDLIANSDSETLKIKKKMRSVRPDARRKSQLILSGSGTGYRNPTIENRGGASISLFVVIWCYPGSPCLKLKLTHPPAWLTTEKIETGPAEKKKLFLEDAL